MASETLEQLLVLGLEIFASITTTITTTTTENH
jgi:hypothetical protein